MSVLHLQDFLKKGAFYFMEIERKYLIKNLPFSLNEYSFHKIEQAYLNTLLSESENRMTIISLLIKVVDLW